MNDLTKTIKKNVVDGFEAKNLPNKLPVNMRMFLFFYPPGTTFLIGRMAFANPNFFIMYSTVYK